MTNSPCPWCGAEPRVRQRLFCGGPAGWIVGCQNRECPVQPHTQAETLSEAERKWNERKDQG